jgi:hypothetical protein
VHDGHGLESRPLAALLQNAFEHLIEAQGRDKQVGSDFDRGSEKLGLRAVGKVFESAGALAIFQCPELCRAGRIDRSDAGLVKET